MKWNKEEKLKMQKKQMYGKDWDIGQVADVNGGRINGNG